MIVNLRNLRMLSGLTQIEAAKRSGVERSRLSLAECGHVELPAKQLEALTGVLRSSIRARAKKYKHALRAPRSTGPTAQGIQRGESVVA